VRHEIVSDRLRLPALSADELSALVDGARTVAGARIVTDWPLDDLGEVVMLEGFAARLRAEPDLVPWRFRLIAERATDTVVGHAGFHDPPADGRAEIGYTVLTPYRRRGIAVEAVTALMSAAYADASVTRFRLAIAPNNEASMAVARRAGFVRVGEQIDDVDGLEWLFERSFRAAPPPC
jgi:[ribosomal protein S5]-alanine N-acetyltransferase